MHVWKRINHSHHLSVYGDGREWDRTCSGKSARFTGMVSTAAKCGLISLEHSEGNDVAAALTVGGRYTSRSNSRVKNLKKM